MRSQHRCPWWAVIVTAVGLAGTEARAHFLFIRIDPMAEGGRWAEVYFSEQAEAGDPKFVEKIASDPALGPDRGRPRAVPAAHGPQGGRPAPGGIAEHGEHCGHRRLRVRRAGAAEPDAVLAPPLSQGDRGPPRRARTGCRPGARPRWRSRRRSGETIRLVALRAGPADPRRGLPRGRRRPDRERDQGRRRRPGDLVAAEARAATRSTPRSRPSRRATAGGKAYEEIREFATLAFAWPLVRPATEADPEAVALFEEALAARAAWGDDFPGFAAHLAGTVDGRPFTGSVTVRDDGTVQVEADDPVALPLAPGSARVDRHAPARRRTGGSGPDQARPVLRFADDQDDHPLGRLLTFVGGGFASSYRVKDRQISVVNRHMGKRNMTITVLDNDKNPEGRFLPRSYLVQYWDAAARDARPRRERPGALAAVPVVGPADHAHRHRRLRCRLLGQERHAFRAPAARGQVSVKTVKNCHAMPNQAWRFRTSVVVRNDHAAVQGPPSGRWGPGSRAGEGRRRWVAPRRARGRGRGCRAAARSGRTGCNRRWPGRRLPLAS